MRMTAYAVAVLAGWALPHTAAAAAVERWNVVDARITLEPDEGAAFVDTLGRYGVAGRRLTVDSVVGTLDRTAPGSYFTRENLAEPDADYVYYDYRMSVAYSLDYAVVDADTREVVGRERIGLRVEENSYDGAFPSFRTQSHGTRVDGSASYAAINGFYMPYFSPGYVPTNDIIIDLDASGHGTLNYDDDFGWPNRGYAVQLGAGLEPEGWWSYDLWLHGAITVSPVPEPEIYALMLVGAVGVFAARRSATRRAARAALRCPVPMA